MTERQSISNQLSKSATVNLVGTEGIVTMNVGSVPHPS